MDIPGYIYVRHSVKPRNIGSAANPKIIYECSYAVDTIDGKRYDDMFQVSSLEVSESDLIAMIVARMDIFAATPPAEPTETIEITAQDGTIQTFEVPL